LFSAVFVFQKSYTGNILEIGRKKAEHPNIKRSFQKTEEGMETSKRLVSPPGGAAQALAAPSYGEGHLVHF
jgi:hypothetical protein